MVDRMSGGARLVGLIAAGVFLLAATVARAEPRIALILGNGAYASVAQLDNPVNDARVIAVALEASGFAVTLLTDAGQGEMNRAIAKFGRDLRDAGADATGLFYYAGHGVQSFGSNYLLPTDAALTDAADLGLVGVPADTVLRQMASARNKTNIVILDACRNNPFVAIPDMNDNGLAEMKAPTGTFLAYSTAPGAVALDGLEGNSPFTEALASEMATRGLPIEQVFKQVRVRVLAASNGQQTPWDTSSLTGQFFFSPPVVRSAEDVAAQQLWDSVRATRDPVQIMLFLRAYPESRFSDEARVALAAAMAGVLTPDAAPAPAPEPVAPVAPVAPQGPDPRETVLIEAAHVSGLAADYEAYLREFPDGTYAELARFELTMLATAPEARVDPLAAGDAAVAPPPAPEEIGTLGYSSVLLEGEEGVAGSSIEALAAGSPLYAPIEGIPDAMWKGQTCSNCHSWTRQALCDQGKTYLTDSGKAALNRQHPYGGAFKRGLRAWANGGCE